MRCSNLIWIACLFLFLTSLEQVEAQFSIPEFLEGAQKDVSLYANELKSGFLSENQYRTPVIHRTEFRTRTNDFNISQDDYRVRINPTNPFEIHENRIYYKTQLSVLMTEYQYTLNKVLSDRYQLLINYLKTLDRQKVIQDRINLIKNEISMYETMMENPGFSAVDYVQAEEDLLNANLEASDLQHRVKRYETEIKAKYEFSGKIEDGISGLIQVNHIQSLIRRNFAEFDTVNNILVKNLNQANQLEEQRIRVEKAEGKRNIGFIQAEYDQQRGKEFDDHMGFQIGIRVPLTNPDRADLSRRKIDLLEDHADVEERKTMINLQCSLLKIDLNYLFDQYRIVSEAGSHDLTSRMLSVDPDMNAEDIIKVKKSELRVQEMIYDLKWGIFESYIDYLYYSGRLSEPPLRNYLSEDLGEI